MCIGYELQGIVCECELWHVLSGSVTHRSVMIIQAVVTCVLCIKLFFLLFASTVTGFITESYVHIKRIMWHVFVK